MSSSKSLRRWHCKCGAVAALALLVAATPARAADPPPLPNEISAADAYRESLPTAAGSRAAGANDDVPALKSSEDAIGQTRLLIFLAVLGSATLAAVGFRLAEGCGRAARN